MRRSSERASPEGHVPQACSSRLSAIGQTYPCQGSWERWSRHFSLTQKLSTGSLLAAILSAIAVLHFRSMLAVPLMR